MAESTAVALRDQQQVGAVAAIDRMNPNQLAVIKNTVAKGASNDELAMFLELANRYQLDPFAREIWCVKMGSEITITTSRDGYLAIANRHPAYEGMESDVVREGDTFGRTPAGIEHSYGAQRGRILGAYALVHRSDRTKPGYFFAEFSEYNKTNSPTWKNYPSAMIVKTAEAMALKRAFSISGLVTQEEMDAAQSPVAPAPAPAAPAPAPGQGLPDLDAAKTGAERMAALQAHAAANGVDFTWAEFGVASQADLENDEAYAKLRQHITGEDPDGAVEGEVVHEGTDEPAISEDQRRRMLAIGAKAGLDKDEVKAVIAEIVGEEISTTAVPVSLYDQVIQTLEALPPADGTLPGTEGTAHKDPQA